LGNKSPYSKVIGAVIESGIIYPLVLVLTLVLYGLNNNAQDLFTGSMCQVVSIVPTMMWVQIRLGLSRAEGASQAQQSGLRFATQSDSTASTATHVGSHRKQNSSLSSLPRPVFIIGHQQSQTSTTKGGDIGLETWKEESAV